MSATVEIVDLREGDEGWQVRSEDLVERWGLEHGPAADEVVAGLVTKDAPELADAVDFDSYETTFSAYVATSAQAEALAKILRSQPTE